MVFAINSIRKTCFKISNWLSIIPPKKRCKQLPGNNLKKKEFKSEPQKLSKRAPKISQNHTKSLKIGSGPPCVLPWSSRVSPSWQNDLQGGKMEAPGLSNDRFWTPKIIIKIVSQVTATNGKTTPVPHSLYHTGSFRVPSNVPTSSQDRPRIVPGSPRTRK